MAQIDLYQGDCLSIMDRMIEDGINVDITFTSPPYNRKRNDKYANYNDVIDDYYTFLCKFTDKALKLTTDYLFINLQSNYYNKRDVYQYIGNYANKIQQIIIWEKSNPLPANGNNITNAYEYFIVLSDKPLKGNYTYTKNHLTTTINTGISKIHKAVMKKEVCEWFIENFTKEGQIIFDPFMGLGTTGIVSKEKNRNFIGIELITDYFNIAKDRINGLQKLFVCR